MILSATLFLLAVIAYSIKELKSFSKLKWTNEDKPYSFWGADSWTRKYKREEGHLLQPRKLNWYYQLFNLKYTERFPGSSTFFVFVTDWPHLMQFFYKLLFCAAFYPLTNWWFALILWVLWGATFTLCDKYLTK